MNLQEIKATAEKEYQDELFREAVERYKQRLRTKKTVWDYIFPYKIVLIKKGDKNVRH